MSVNVSAPSIVDADFMMICKGDSMINARIFDGDYVYIRQQDTVESGEIAAVVIDRVTTLGRIWKHLGYMVLEPANPRYASRIFCDDDPECIQIVGKVLACTFVFSDCNLEGSE